ncbi:MAG: 8-oxo-dGTP diphosphatase [bacterium]
MRNTTLLFLVKKQDAKIVEILLAMKKRGFGVGRWNGVGGKLAIGETVEDAVIRESSEEIGVSVEKDDLLKVAELSFYFPHRPDFDQLVHVYITEKWLDTPIESEEMKPFWYTIENMPFDSMWPDDKFWLPQVIEGKLVKGEFIFGEGDVILKQDISIVNKF